jgi:hypothetical protein
MKHALIIISLLGALILGFAYKNKELARSVFGQSATTPVAPQTSGATNSPPAQSPFPPPVVASPVTNTVIVTNTNSQPSGNTNSWQRETAGRYADLINEIRNARGHVQ